MKNKFTGGLIGVVLAGMGSLATAAVPQPMVSPAPATDAKQHPWNEAGDDWRRAGYEEHEFFVEGKVGSTAAPYKTRMLVRYPSKASAFNGTVVVEWLNVSGGHDLEIVGPSLRALLLREGYAWAGVTPQPVGIGWLKQWNPQRYGSLTHPALPAGPLPKFIRDESYSDGIFSQLGAALKSSGANAPFAGLKVQRLIATGQSQSAGRLTNYINKLHSAAQVYDGYLLWSGPGEITEHSTKIIGLNSEQEVLWRVARFNGTNDAPSALPRPKSPNAQEDMENFRLYEVPGAGHTPVLASLTSKALRERDIPGYKFLACDYAPGAVPIEDVGMAALSLLNRWIVSGTAPPSAPRVQITVDAQGHASIARDAYGNALGGIRLPQQEFPLGHNLANNKRAADTATSTSWCELKPGFVPFTSDELHKLYPQRSAYVSKVEGRVRELEREGLLLPPEGRAIEHDAQAVKLP